MTTLREAAQQALETLEQLQGGCTDSDDGTVEAITVWCPEVIDALRAALAQQQTKRACCTYPDCRCPIDKSTVCAKGLPEQAEPVEPVAHRVVAGALFDFMGWLTSRRERLVLSSIDDAAPAADAIKDFAEMRGLSLDDAKVQDWNAALAQQAELVEPVDVGLLEYRGNSVAFIHQKMTAYRTGIDVAWDAFRAKGLHPDGKTSLADMIAKHTAPPQRKPLTEEEIEACRQQGYDHDGLHSPFSF